MASNDKHEDSLNGWRPYNPPSIEQLSKENSKLRARLAESRPEGLRETRFNDFDDEAHPFRKWWVEHGQFMLSGGGRRESIWAARGWIAREQFSFGVDVTGDSLREAGSRDTVPSAEGLRERFDAARIKEIIQEHETNYISRADGKWDWSCACGKTQWFYAREFCMDMTISHWADMIFKEAGFRAGADAQHWQDKLSDMTHQNDQEAARLREAFNITPDGRSLEDQLMEAYAAALRAGKGQWISVEEQLPEVGTWVLAWKPNHVRQDIVEYSKRSEQHLKFIRRDGQWWDGGYQITHWQPLPIPPAGKPNEDK